MIRSSRFGDLLTLSNTLDQVTNPRWVGSQFDLGSGAPRVVPMPIDVYATGDDAALIAAVPGMQPDDLDLTVHQHTVTLPFPIDAEHAQATFDHGLVRVSLPKAESVKPKTIAISRSPNEAIAPTRAS